MPFVTDEIIAQVAFIGAGPGDPELLTLKAQRLIGRADCIIYADSLVNPAVCQHAKAGAQIYGSSTLTLEAMMEIMLTAVAQKQFVVRLQSGDPAIYGAMHEQRRLLDLAGVAYMIVPGVSSIFAAAAVAGVELTVPDVAQSLILTRREGRVEMPEKETLRAFASHGTTLGIFMSITRVRQVVEDLLAGGYAEDTPALVVYRATWPEQQIIRATLATLVPAVKAARISRQALIIVGRALGMTSEDVESADGEAVHRSHLYSPTYKHLFRGGVSDAKITPPEPASPVTSSEPMSHVD
jgi:precorrin-4/cobalt-precorrin-4 C11-methyltransferase